MSKQHACVIPSESPDISSITLGRGEVDLCHWMSSLPYNIASQPLNFLAIPGSHDSFTSRIKIDSKPSPDGNAYSMTRRLPQSLASRVIYPWTVTQTLSMVEQLHVGIRYFDLRVAVQHKSDRTSYDFVLVHGQYGAPLVEELRSIVQFLKSHPKEVVILDCNHCHQFETAEQLHKYEDAVFEVLSHMLYPPRASIPSLRDLWAAGKQVIFISCIMTDKNARFWPSTRMISLWPKTDNVDKMLAYLDEHYGPQFPRDSAKFYAFQGVLTPTLSYVLSHLDGTLRELAKVAGEAFLPWLRDPKRRAGSQGVNVTLLDFVYTDFPHYARTVINLNYITWTT